MKYHLEAAKKEWFWAIARSCGPARELSRVRAFIDSVGGASETLSEIRWQHPAHGYFPGLSAKGWHDPAEYPWTARLVESYDTIRAEADRIAARQLYSPQISSLATGEWNVLHLHVMGEATAAGKLLCPRTSRLTSELPGVGEGGWCSSRVSPAAPT